MKTIFYITNYLGIVFLCAFFLFPNVTLADYSFKDRQFNSYSEYKSYVIEYMEAWRIANGTSLESSTGNNQDTDRRDHFEIDTNRTTDISKNSARLYGSFDLKQSEKVRVWFDYGLYPTQLILRSDTATLSNDKDDRFDIKVVELKSDTKYFYRAGGINEDGVVRYGDIKTFETDVDIDNRDSLIQVKTLSPKYVDESNATFKSYVRFKKEDTAFVWFEYGDDEDDLYKKTKKALVYKDDGRYYTKLIKRLDSETEYYYRVVGQDVHGVKNYGKIYKFKTKVDIEDEEPEVTIYRAENITDHTARLRGYVDMNDFNDGIVFFVYGEDREEIDEIRTKYSRYRHIRERGDDRQVILLDDDVDRAQTFTFEAKNLDKYTRHYFAIGVEYEDENDDEVLTISRTYYFKTRN